VRSPPIFSLRDSTRKIQRLALIGLSPCGTFNFGEAVVEFLKATLRARRPDDLH